MKRRSADSVATRLGITLLELMLALGLTSLVLAAVAMAIDLYLRTLDRRRQEVDEAQLVRAVLRRMADDLRSVVRFSPPNAEELESLMSAGASLDPTKALQGLGVSPPGSGANGTSTDPATDSASLAASLTPAVVPGLYGSATELQVDVSRLPRVDEYSPVVAGPGLSAVDIPSDVRTVTYFVRTGMAGGLPGLVPPEEAGMGLVRREIGRARALWTGNQGDAQQLAQTERLLAPEVAGLEFRYFDGQQWLSQWDSTALGRLPSAVEILVLLRSEATNDPAATARLESHRVVVHLPAAGIISSPQASGMKPLGF